MEVEQVVQLVRRIDAAATTSADPTSPRDTLASGLDDVRRLIAWAYGCQTRLAARVAEVASFPEKVIAEASRTTVADAGRLLERAETLDAFPALAQRLDEGHVSAGHIDTLGRATRDLTPQQRDTLAAAGDDLAARARGTTVDQFRSLVQTTVRQIVADDGVSRFQRQQQATRLRTWIDRDTGMGHLAGAFDPLTYLRITTRLTEAVETQFATTTPASCPSDPLAKQDHLRALALAALIEQPSGARAGRPARPEFVVVIDTRTSPTTTDPTALAARPGAVVDFGIPIEIPQHVLTHLAGAADAHTIIVNGGIVLHAPGQLDLGRTTRIANRAQRRALRALHPTCAIPGCHVRYDNCDIHHIIWWRNGGHTNLNNLIPLCNHHHHAIHDLGWKLHLDTNRNLTITLPDHTTMTTGPPTRTAA